MLVFNFRIAARASFRERADRGGQAGQREAPAVIDQLGQPAQRQGGPPYAPFCVFFVSLGFDVLFLICVRPVAREEHLAPLFVAAGAAGDSKGSIMGDFWAGALCLTSYQFID